MPSGGYHFDADDLSFRHAKESCGRRVLRWLSYLLATFAVAVISFLLFSLFFDTPLEQQYRRENTILRHYVDSLDASFDRIAGVIDELEERDDQIYRLIFESEPLESDREASARLLTEMFNLVETHGVGHVSDLTSRLLGEVHMRVSEEQRHFDTLVALCQGQPELMRSIPSIHPIAAGYRPVVSAPFGVRMHPFYKVLKFHPGIDYALSVGTPVRVTADGVVSEVYQSQRGVGRSVRVDHGHGYQTIYSHLDRIDVRCGSRLVRGDAIGLSGNTGMSMAPHLHYEIRHNGEPVDPLNYLFMELDPLALAEVASRAVQVGQTLD